jgi:AraC-type DNA-binding domain-containing proteins
MFIELINPETRLCAIDATALRIHDELTKLRSEIYSNPRNNWSISLMADKLYISYGYFQNIYKVTFFISCMSDVIESRITYSKELLIQSDLLIREISNLCGYQNEVHFMRQFKKITTLTHNEYHRLNSKLGKQANLIL